MVSKKKPKAEAEDPRGKPAEEPEGAESAGKKAKALKAASKKASDKKAAGRKTQGKKTSSKKTSSKKAGSRKPASTKKVSLDPFEVARETMKGSVPAIVEAMVEKAKRGSCSHAKTLLEMTGAKHMFGDEAEIADSGEPWAKLVLERMDEAEQESLTERLTQDLPDFAAE